MDWRKIVVIYLLKKQNNKCTRCGVEFNLVSPPEVDHIISQKNGGADDLDNFQLLHTICNKQKGAGPPVIPSSSENNPIGKWDLLKLKALKESLETTQNQKETAKMLGITRRQINHLIYKYKLPNNASRWILPD